MTTATLILAAIAAGYAIAPTVIDRTRARWQSRTVAVSVDCPACAGHGWRGSTAHACPQCYGDGQVIRVGPARELNQ